MAHDDGDIDEVALVGRDGLAGGVDVVRAVAVHDTQHGHERLNAQAQASVVELGHRGALHRRHGLQAALQSECVDFAARVAGADCTQPAQSAVDVGRGDKSRAGAVGDLDVDALVQRAFRRVSARRQRRCRAAARLFRRGRVCLVWSSSSEVAGGSWRN